MPWKGKHKPPAELVVLTLGEVLGFLVFQILIGGVVGSIVMLWKLAEAAVYLIWGIYAGIVWVYRIRKSGMEE